jgi:multiple RNA-binding domain-containing protein 1
VKNIPRHLSEERLREHFGKQGIVTDAKIMRKNDKSRNFAFVGYKTEAEAAAARKHFNGTFFDTSKMAIEFARPQGDPNLPRAWSKFSKGSSAYAALNRPVEGGKAAKKAAEEREKEEIEKKKSRFREFLKVIGATKDNK